MFNLKSEINKSMQWKRLEKLAKKMRKIEMRDMFARDGKRAEKYSLELENMVVDFSKNRIDDKVFKALMDLAKKAKIRNKIMDMFEGKKINVTENRAVLHVALRNRENTPIYVDGENVMPEINRVLAKIKQFSEAVRLGKFVGYTGKKLTNIVNIGIGGSDLGPKMAVEALKKYMPKEMNCYFVSNIDGTACAEVLNKVDPETTLFIVCSKTFTTIETLTNAKTCRKWLIDALGEHATSKHFVAYGGSYTNNNIAYNNHIDMGIMSHGLNSPISKPVINTQATQYTSRPKAPNNGRVYYPRTSMNAANVQDRINQQVKSQHNLYGGPSRECSQSKKNTNQTKPLSISETGFRYQI